MSKFTDELSDLVQKIVSGKVSKQQVCYALDSIKENNPDEKFVHFQPERKDKPWNYSYLKELEDLFYYGASSREFIEYMAEVSCEVYRAKRAKKLLLSVLIGVAAFAVIITFFRFFVGD